MILNPLKMFREMIMVNWNIGAPPILSFLNKLMKSWKNRVGPGVEDRKMDIDDSDDYDNDEDEDDDDANEFYFGIF